MPSVRRFLVRGLLAGLVAGILTFAVAYVVGEPSIRAGIALEQAGAEPAGHDHAEAGAAHDHADEGGTVVPRSLQATAGLLTATLLTGVTLGGVLGVLSALALGRFGRLRARGTTLLVTGTGFVALFVLPFVAYPPNPPAVGAAETIGLRTSLYVAMVAISLISGVTAVLTARHLTRSWGAWYAALAAVAGYLLVTVTAMALLPTYDEVPAGFPAALLYQFRQASFVVQLTLWSVLGVTLAELLHRLTVRPAPATTRPVEATGMRG